MCVPSPLPVLDILNVEWGNLQLQSVFPTIRYKDFLYRLLSRR